MHIYASETRKQLPIVGSSPKKTMFLYLLPRSTTVQHLVDRGMMHFWSSSHERSDDETLGEHLWRQSSNAYQVDARQGQLSFRVFRLQGK